MPEFRLDTGDEKRHAFYNSLPEFAKGYIEAALFVGFGHYTESGDVVEVTDLGLDQMSMALLKAMASDARCFQVQNDSELTLVCSGQDYNRVQAGHDFWFTRNGCGVGYWDRPIDPDINGACEAFESLTVAATDEGDFSLSVEPIRAGADPSDPAQWVIEADFMPKHLDKFQLKGNNTAESTPNNGKRRLGFKVTYDIITDESAAAGDVAALGWIDPKTGTQCADRPDAIVLRAALGLLNPVGYAGYFLESVEPDSSDPKSTKSIRWIWRVYGVEKEGDKVLSETRTLHFPKSTTPATRARLVSLLTKC